MKEDLFVRRDGQPVVFLMGDVREREKVVWLRTDLEIIKNSRWERWWRSGVGWCLTTQARSTPIMSSGLLSKRCLLLRSCRAGCWWGPSCTPIDPTTFSSIGDSSMCFIQAFHAFLSSYVMDCIRNGTILGNLNDYKVFYKFSWVIA